ncbi:MAG TPA: glycosyltransferase family 2 protein [Thermoleophilaceae bacterium]|nr:glycosyltransferase family 2 protein [Thermoleophilaceae bacterium]
MGAPGQAAAERRGGPATLDAKRDVRLSIVLPAYNEEDNVEAAISEATAAAERLVAEHEIVVVDDGSSDSTAERVRGLAVADPRIRLVQHDDNRGYGEALRSGFLSSRLDFVFFTDADLQFDMGELVLLLPYAGTVDVVAGYRINRQDTLVRRINAHAWNCLVRVLFYVPVRDIDCAFKLFDRRALRAVDIEAVGAMVNTELMVKLGRSGASVVEVGVHHRPRRAGEARGASPRVIATALREILRMRGRLSSLDGRGP